MVGKKILKKNRADENYWPELGHGKCRHGATVDRICFVVMIETNKFLVCLC